MTITIKSGDKMSIASGLTFPAGERHVKAPSDMSDMNTIDFILDFTGSDDLIDLLQLVDIYRFAPKKTLSIPYMPFGRQDRRVNLGEAHALKVFADLVNSCGFDAVYTTDAHSDVVHGVFDRLIELKQHDALRLMLLSANQERQYDFILSPDLGASKKTEKISSMLGIPVLQGMKTRNTQSGQVNSFSVIGNTDIIENTSILVVDDICDGGATFNAIAAWLLPYGAKSLDLMVTHGIFSKGLCTLSKNFDRIYAYNLVGKAKERLELGPNNLVQRR